MQNTLNRYTASQRTDFFFLMRNEVTNRSEASEREIFSVTLGGKYFTRRRGFSARALDLAQASD